jgi:hypothetical protein
VAKWHFILDYETMGQDPTTCAAVDCSYVCFDWDRFTSDEPYTFNGLLNMTQRAKFSVQDQVKRHGFQIDQSTVEWWSQQDPEVRKLIRPANDDISIEIFLADLQVYLERHPYLKFWWSRSNTFDPIILWHMTAKAKVKPVFANLLPHYKVRDTRSFIDGHTNMTLKSTGFVPMKDEKRWESLFKQHSSRHDIVADILRLQTLVRLGNNLEITE